MIVTAGALYPPARDDTIELLRCVQRAGRTVTLDEGRVYRTRTVRFAEGVHLVIPASTVIEVIDDGTATSRSLIVAVPDVTITVEGQIRGTSSARTAVYGLIRAEGADRLRVEGAGAIHTSPSQAVWVYGGDGIVTADFEVYDTGADGIQFTRGATNFEILRHHIHDTGDDAIGIIGYASTDHGGEIGVVEHGPMDGFLVDSPLIENVGTGRGIAISGGHNGLVKGFSIDGVDQAGVLVAGGSSAWRSANVTVQDGHIRDVGRNIPPFGTGDGVYLTQSDGVTLARLDIDGCPGDRVGIRALNSTSTDLDVGTGHTFGPNMSDDIVIA